MENVKPFDKDFYARLGLTKNAGYDDIRKMYKKCVMKFHPDRNPENPQEAEEKMKMINEAYEVLNDSEKREIYDTHGEEGLREGGGGGFNPFAQMFGFPGTGRRNSPSARDRVPPQQQLLEVTLEDIYNGNTRRIEVERHRVCKNCSGKGVTKEGAVKKCDSCNGMGRVLKIVQQGNYIEQVVIPCDDCRDGEVIDLRYACEECDGKKVMKEKKILEVHVEKGMKTGQKITKEGEGDEVPDLKAGHIIFVVKVVEHDIFKRDGMNLEMTKKINLTEALTGVIFAVTQLDGRKLRVASPSDLVIQPGQVMMIRKEGLPRYKYPYEQGNLLIKFEIEFPKRIPKDVKLKLIAMLPHQKEEVEDEDEMEDVVLEDPERVFSPGGRGTAYDSDEDDEQGMGGDGQTISCLIQ